jgi:hypothetical protein
MGWLSRGGLASGDVCGQPTIGGMLLRAPGRSRRVAGREQLYLSHRTVRNHLYRIFPKLGITSRAELAAVVGASPDPVQGTVSDAAPTAGQALSAVGGSYTP